MNGKIKAVVLLGLMYGFGVTSGIAWQSYQNRHFASPRAIFAERRIKRLEAQLRLSPTQVQAMHDIFQRAHERATQINEEVSWDLSDIHRDSVKAIREILTPDQVKKFDTLHKRSHLNNRDLPSDDPEESSAAQNGINS